MEPYVFFILVFLAWTLMGNVIAHQHSKLKVLLFGLLALASVSLLSGIGISSPIFFCWASFSIISGAVVGYLWPQKQVTKVRKNHSIPTELPRFGTVKGPDFGLPEGFSLSYSGAQLSPTVFYYYDNESGELTGIIFDFGNGKASLLCGTATITGVRDGLSVKIHSTNGTLSI